MIDLVILYQTNPHLYNEAYQAANTCYVSKTQIEKQSLDEGWHTGFMEGYVYAKMQETSH